MSSIRKIEVLKPFHTILDKKIWYIFTDERIVIEASHLDWLIEIAFTN